MKLKLLAVLAIAGVCAGSLALADDPSSQDSQPIMNLADNSQTGTMDNSTGSAKDNAGSSQDNSTTPPAGSDDNSNTDTSTGDDDY